MWPDCDVSEQSAGVGPGSLSRLLLSRVSGVSLHFTHQMDINDDNRGELNYVISLGCGSREDNSELKFGRLDHMENVFFVQNDLTGIFPGVLVQHLGIVCAVFSRHLFV